MEIKEGSWNRGNKAKDAMRDELKLFLLEEVFEGLRIQPESKWKWHSEFIVSSWKKRW
jgi:hypothetical protein